MDDFENMTPEDAQAEVDATLADSNHAYYKSNHPGHAAAVERMNRLYETVHGTEPASKRREPDLGLSEDDLTRGQERQAEADALAHIKKEHGQIGVDLIDAFGEHTAQVLEYAYKGVKGLREEFDEIDDVLERGTLDGKRLGDHPAIVGFFASIGKSLEED
jgi:hypothetical protein